jgi:hypothetical protein
VNSIDLHAAYAPPREESVELPLAGDEDDERERIARLPRERHVRAIGLMSIVWGVFFVLQGFALLLKSRGFAFVGATLPIALSFGLISGGSRLRRLERKGATTFTIASFAAVLLDVLGLSALFFVSRAFSSTVIDLSIVTAVLAAFFGSKTIITIAMIWYVLGSGAIVTSDDHRALVLRTPEIPMGTALWAKVLLGLLAFLSVVAVVALFLLGAAAS